MAYRAAGWGARALSVGLAMAGALGCTSGRPSADDVGVARLSIMQAPADVACLRVTAAGALRSVVRSFDLVAGQATVFVMTGLPIGDVAFGAEAFSVGCSAVAPSTVPGWTGDPVTVGISPGLVANVALLLKRNGRANVSVDFERDPPDAGADRPNDMSVPTTPPIVFQRAVTAGDDDAEDWTTSVGAGCDLTSSDLELGKDLGFNPIRDRQVVGLRFQNVTVPRNATIVSAHVQFIAKAQTDANGPGQTAPESTSFVVRGQAADNPPAFLAAAGNVKTRPTTAASAMWSNVPLWNTADEAGPGQRTSDLAAIVQELVNRPGWAPGNALVLIIDGTGLRSAQSFNTASGTKAPVLRIEYTGGDLPTDGGSEPMPPPPPPAPSGTSSQGAYMLPVAPGVTTAAILTVGDSPVSGSGPSGAYKLVGVPDGMGAFDNGDGTFTLLVNHELASGAGVARAHGAAGAFVSKWRIRKSDLVVLEGADLIQRLATWNVALGAHNAPATGLAMGRFCSGDLPPKSAFWNAATGRGFDGRLYMNGEEVGEEGRVLAHGLDGTTYELPALGKFNVENALAHPGTGDRTLVVGTDDSGGGQIYVYVGTKKTTGNPAERAGLTGGTLYGLKVTGFATESASSGIPSGTAFTLHSFGNVEGMSGAALQSASVAGGVTGFQRPEDGHWDPTRPNDFYFVTTASFSGNSRLWRVHFHDLSDPTLGGTIDMVLGGTEVPTGSTERFHTLDNMAVASDGDIYLQEDPGGTPYLAQMFRLRVDRSGTVVVPASFVTVARADAARFVSGGAGFLTQDEETSGVIDVSDILGPGKLIANVQSHHGTNTELVEGGQLLLITVP